MREEIKERGERKISDQEVEEGKFERRRLKTYVLHELLTSRSDLLS